MIKLIKKESYQTMPWKNGLGSTEQIAIFPADADFQQETYQWRLSSATVKTSSFFSLFNGYDRCLAVLDGQGFALNGNPMPRLAVRNFSGEIPTRCELLGEQAIDLGLIYRRDKWSAKMTLEQVTNAQTIFFERGTHVFYCVSGDLSVNDVGAKTGDTILLEGPFEATLRAPQKAQYFYIRLST